MQLRSMNALFVEPMLRWCQRSDGVNVLGYVLAVAGVLSTPGEHGAAMGDGLQQQPVGPSAALDKVCKDGQTLFGIDVSYYQGTIDWSAVAADGVQFAIIRVSHSTQFYDPQFDANWEGARAAGIHAGVYQYFQPDEDPIAQAQLLLDHMGPLKPGDLPPVIDVEAAAGQSGSAIAAAVGAWLEYVEAELGVRPIIYTGPYFWQDNVGSDAFGDYPLWIAHYGTDCPLTPAPWSRWNFHQFTSSGSTAGISGNVDQNVFNGSLDDLLALGTGEAPLCGTIGAQGGTIDNGDDCETLFGNSMYWREEEAGVGGSLMWTNATDYEDPSNYAIWSMWFEEPGEYELEVNIDPGYGETKQAAYRITHEDGETEVVIDQSAQDGWTSLGTFSFTAGAEYRVRLDDNTGEAGDLEISIVYDALRVTPVNDDGEGSTGGDPTGAGTTGAGTTGDGTTEPESGTDGSGSSGGGPALPAASSEAEGCGCHSSDRRSPAPVLALLGLFAIRRRRRR
jgi:lysozyme